MKFPLEIYNLIRLQLIINQLRLLLFFCNLYNRIRLFSGEIQMLSVKQAANQLRKSEDTIRRWAACGKLSAQKRGGRWVILSTKICNSTLEKKPVAQAVITEDAIGKIVEGISEKIGVMANSSSRTSTSFIARKQTNQNRTYKSIQLGKAAKGRAKTTLRQNSQTR